MRDPLEHIIRRPDTWRGLEGANNVAILSRPANSDWHGVMHYLAALRNWTSSSRSAAGLNGAVSKCLATAVAWAQWGSFCPQWKR